MADFYEFSRFKHTQQIIVDGKETLGVWAAQSWLKELPDDSSILTFNVTNEYEGRPDKISNEIYGTPMLDWVLIAFNAKFFDNSARACLNWPRAGNIIRYPMEALVFPEVA